MQALNQLPGLFGVLQGAVRDEDAGGRGLGKEGGQVVQAELGVVVLVHVEEVVPGEGDQQVVEEEGLHTQA